WRPFFAGTPPRKTAGPRPATPPDGRMVRALPGVRLRPRGLPERRRTPHRNPAPSPTRRRGPRPPPACRWPALPRESYRNPLPRAAGRRGSTRTTHAVPHRRRDPETPRWRQPSRAACRTAARRPRSSPAGRRDPADQRIDALIRHQFGDRQEVVLGGLPVERVHIHGRMDDLALAAVRLPDAPLHVA